MLSGDMKNPLPVLVAGYGLASLCAALSYAFGAHAAAAAALAWIGGGVLTLAFAATPPFRNRALEAASEEERREILSSLTAMERDRALDARPGDAAGAASARGGCD